MSAPEVLSDPADVLGRLRVTYASGRTRALSWRLAQLDAMARMLVEERRAIEDALVADLGRARLESFLAEIYAIEREVAALRRGLPRWCRPERVRTPLVLQPARSTLRREPLGIVAVIGPWNYPLNLVLVPLAAALAAGNCVVCKPSELAPASAELLARVVPRYLDPDAVAVCTGGPQISEALIDGGVDHVFFTGSARVGRLVMARAARTLTPVTLELGGKSPVYVDESVDVGVAARRIVWGKLINAGQSCIAPDFVLVARARHGELLDALVAEIVRMYGDDPEISADYGRIINDAHVERLAGMLHDHAGRVVCGGRVVRSARYVAPTVIDSPAPDSPVMTEEVFGPLLPVVPVEDVDAAIGFLAGRPSPLALYVFSSDVTRTDRLLSAVRSGTVCVNTTMHQFAASGLPFGGVGESGMGRYHGRHGYEQLSHVRPVLTRPLHPELGFASPPFSQAKELILRSALTLPGALRRALGPGARANPAGEGVTAQTRRKGA